jgi:hypothetical protein
MTPKYVAPSISAHSFSCPHCGTFAHQTWSRLFAAALYDKDKLPLVTVQCNREFDETMNAEVMRTFNGLSAGELFLDDEITSQRSYVVYNCHLSQCYSCNKYALWLHDNLLHPAPHLHIECNSDMPDEIRADFNEAREIFFLSPRGAAALLRLAVQKLCAVLGGQARISTRIPQIA